MSCIEWIDVREKPPSKPGWYLAATNPINHGKLDKSRINNWREKFGCTKVWFNPDAVGMWYEPDPHGYKSICIKEIITHWAELPKVPLVDD